MVSFALEFGECEPSHKLHSTRKYSRLTMDVRVHTQLVQIYSLLGLFTNTQLVLHLKGKIEDDINWLVADLAQLILERSHKGGIALDSIDLKGIASQVSRLLKGTAGELELADFLFQNGWQTIRLKPFIGPERHVFPDLLISKARYATAFVEVKNVLVKEDEHLDKAFSVRQLQTEYYLADSVGIPLVLAFKDKETSEWRFSRIIVEGGYSNYPIIVGTVTKELEDLKSTWIGSSRERFDINKLEEEVIFGMAKRLLATLVSVPFHLDSQFQKEWCKRAGRMVLFNLGRTLLKEKKGRVELEEVGICLKKAEKFLKSYINTFQTSSS